MIAIRTKELGRVYKGQNGRPDIRALDGVNLEVEAGEVRGLLGPNGAGKTTLVKILCTILLPTSGEASVMGHDVRRAFKAVRQSIGIVIGGERGLYWNLTGRQNLEYWAALYYVPAGQTSERITSLLTRVGMLDRADDLVDTYSRGMKQRLHLARGLIGDPEVLFLDEPTSGMDPVAAHDFRGLVKSLKAEGKTILVTTHDMAEAESICDRVALIDHGRLLTVETPRTLARMMSDHERIDFECQHPALAAQIRAMPGVARVDDGEGPSSYRVELSDEAASSQVLGVLVSAGVTSIRTSRPSLEEVYLRLVGTAGRQ